MRDKDSNEPEKGHPSGRAVDDHAFFGRMNAPTASAVLRGPCGDSMEFYLFIRDGVIIDAKCFTEGCSHTRTCGVAVARRARGETINGALGINARAIIESEVCLPREGKHCAILAVSTLYRAIADYLLAP